MRFTLAVFTFSFVIVYMLVRQLLPLLSRRLPDTPNARSAHQCPTPRGGGLAFVLIAGLTSVISGFAFGGLAWLPALALPLAFVGLADDRFDLPAALRYSVQLLTAVSFVVISPWVQAWPWPVLVLPVVVLAILAVINFTNFMDGLDGLVAGCMVLMLTTSFVITCRGLVSSSALFPIAALVGGLIGFLFWNWSPAKVFMGDVGSTFLGAVFAGLVLQQSSPLAALALLLVGFPFSVMLFSACCVAALLDRLCFVPTVYICSSVSIRRAGPMPVLQGSTSSLRASWPFLWYSRDSLGC